MRAQRGVTYRRTSDGHRFKYVGPMVGQGERGHVNEFTRGWMSLGPVLVGRLLGTPWNWPLGYEAEREGTEQ